MLTVLCRSCVARSVADFVVCYAARDWLWVTRKDLCCVEVQHM